MRAIVVIGLGALVSLLALSCASSQLSPKNVNDPSLATCSGSKARKAFDFTVAVSTKVKSGTPIADDKSLILNSTAGRHQFLVQNWVKVLLSDGFNLSKEGNEVVYAESQELKHIRDRSNLGKQALVRTGPFNFVLSPEDLCKDLVDPVTNKKIVYESGKCGEYCFVEGVDDPGFFGNNNLFRTYPCQSSWFNGINLAKQTGFRGWDVLSENVYYSVPEREKDTVCEKAGLDKNCFQLPTEKVLETYSEQAHDPASSFYTEYPFTRAFVLNNCPNCGHGYAHFFVKSLNSSSHLRLQRESAFAKDLFLRAGTQITSRIQGEWIIYRIHWDPSLFCKYAKPTSDFYTH